MTVRILCFTAYHPLSILQQSFFPSKTVRIVKRVSVRYINYLWQHHMFLLLLQAAGVLAQIYGSAFAPVSPLDIHALAGFSCLPSDEMYAVNLNIGASSNVLHLLKSNNPINTKEAYESVNGKYSSSGEAALNLLSFFTTIADELNDDGLNKYGFHLTVRIDEGITGDPLSYGNEVDECRADSFLDDKVLRLINFLKTRDNDHVGPTIKLESCVGEMPGKKFEVFSGIGCGFAGIVLWDKIDTTREWIKLAILKGLTGELTPIERDGRFTFRRKVDICAFGTRCFSHKPTVAGIRASKQDVLNNSLAFQRSPESVLIHGD